ncbi:MAG: rhomboid family intramembrane serine protease [Deltaproteobacteria bacterium]|nr:MAG: rhomboid family intramembrane serine protease [Deltaproteobacteria bacterium]
MRLLGSVGAEALAMGTGCGLRQRGGSPHPAVPAPARVAAGVPAIACQKRSIMSTPSPSALRRLRELLLPGRAPVTTLMMLFSLAWWVMLALQTSDIGSFSVSSLLRVGANHAPFTLHGEPWRLVSYAFLHGGLIHLGMNLYALHVVGGMVEGRFGSARYAILYVVAAIGAGLASALGSPLAPSVGASGAILGVIGAGAVAGHLMGNRIGEHIRNQLLVWFLIIMGIGLVGGSAGLRFDNWAHFGGFMTGAAMGALWFIVEKRKRHAGPVTAAVAVLVVAASIAAAVTPWVVYRDVPVLSEDTGPRAETARARAWAACRDALRAEPLADAMRPCRAYRMTDWHMGRGYVVMVLIHEALDRPVAAGQARAMLARVHPSGASLERHSPTQAERMLRELADR